MSSGGGDQIVGYKYFLGVQLALCHGPVDSITELVVGERSAWAGSLDYAPGATPQVFVQASELFGGQGREGGVSGFMRVNFGDYAVQDAYLVSQIGAHVPSYRGLATVVFEHFYWSAMNPYFKAPWLRVKRILKGWSRGAAWYPAKAQVGTLDMNPAHIIYQCLTDTRWGMGYTPGDIDDASFTAAADKLHAEGFGMSLIWDQQMIISEFIKIIIDTIDGSLRLDLTTGKFVLKLIRNDYVTSSLPQLNPTNVLELTSFQRAAWGDTANEMVVKYTSRDQNQVTVTVQDLANIEVQGAVVSTTREYLGIRDQSLAMRVAMRDLATLSAPLASVSLVANRILWDKEVGDVIALTWPKLGVENAAFRITSIDKGTILDGKIQITAIEDVFGLPSSTYTGTQGGGWTDPVQPPQPVVQQLAIEAPYWEVAHLLPQTTIDQLPYGYGYSQILASRSGGSDFSYLIYSSPDGSSFTDTGKTGPFTPTALLSGNIDDIATTITLRNAKNLSLANIGDYAYLGNECVGVKTIDYVTQILTIDRGVLDTVPVAHTDGEPVMFATLSGTDQEQHVAGEMVHYKLLPRNGRGTLALSAASETAMSFNYRAERPFPPGNVRLNGTYRPKLMQNRLTTIDWSSRNRVSQTVDLVPQTAGNITPEAGTYYALRVLKKTNSAASTWTEALNLSAMSVTSYTIQLSTPASIPLPGTGVIESYIDKTFANGERLMARFTVQALGKSRVSTAVVEGNTYSAGYTSAYPDKKSTATLHVGGALRTGDTITLQYTTNNTSYTSPPTLSPPDAPPARIASPTYASTTFSITDSDTSSTVATAIRTWINTNLGALWTVTSAVTAAGDGHEFTLQSVNNGAYFATLTPTLSTTVPGAGRTVDVIYKIDPLVGGLSRVYLRYWEGTTILRETLLCDTFIQADFLASGNQLVLYGNGFSGYPLAPNRFIASLCVDAITTTNVLRGVAKREDVIGTGADGGIVLAPGPRHIVGRLEPSVWAAVSSSLYDLDLYSLATVTNYPLASLMFGYLSTPYRMFGDSNFSQVGTNSPVANPAKAEVVMLTGIRNGCTGISHVTASGTSLSYAATAVPASAQYVMAGPKIPTTGTPLFGDVYTCQTGEVGVIGYGLLAASPSSFLIYSSGVGSKFAIKQTYYVDAASSYAVTPTTPTTPVDDACKVRVELKSTRDGLDSWQTQVVETELYGFGINFGNYFGGIAP